MKKVILITMSLIMVLFFLAPVQAAMNTIDYIQRATMRLIEIDPSALIWTLPPSITTDFGDSRYIIATSTGTVYAEVDTLNILTLLMNFDVSTSSLDRTSACISSLEWPEQNIDFALRAVGQTPVQMAKDMIYQWILTMTEEQTDMLKQGKSIIVHKSSNWVYYIAHRNDPATKEFLDYLLFAHPSL